LEIEAEAEAEQSRRRARGEADAIFAKMEAQARGNWEILSKQAEGFREMVNAAGGSNEAIRLLIADKMEDLVKTQVEAIKNIKIDKVTVWDSMNSGDGKTGTANFLSGLMKSIPPMNEMFDMAGMQLPEYLGRTKESVFNNGGMPVMPEAIQDVMPKVTPEADKGPEAEV
jgi:flotillin